MTGTSRAFLIVTASIAVVILIAFAAMRRKPQESIPTPAFPQPVADSDLTSVPRIQLAEARQRIESGSVTLIDVRDADSYIAGHIPGALQIPLSRIEGEAGYLPREKPIITYCT